MEALKILSACLAAVTGLCYLYQIVYLFLPFLRRHTAEKADRQLRYAILIAARNEEAVLPHLLDSIRRQDYPAALISTFVVADNCTDRTARVAKDHGANVFSRFNSSRVGKGYALEYLLDQIRDTWGLNRFDAFLVFDADNLLSPDYITQINTVATRYDAFCGYRNAKNFGENWLSGAYGLWYLHDSTHLNRSRMAAGVSCAVNGTGFGFSRKLLERLGGWNFHTLTEDIEFSAWCATHGVTIGYCHDAIVYDEQPTSFAVSIRQRTRWTQGRLQVSVKYAGDLIRGILRGGKTGWASFETATLSVWGYGLSAVCGAVTFAMTFVLQGWMGLTQAAIAALVGSYFTFLGVGAWTLATEWHRIRATPMEKLRAVLAFPVYMISFLPISACALFRKFQWQPVEHRAAISSRQLLGK